jgi:uncharacterized membrane protein SirB2
MKIQETLNTISEALPTIWQVLLLLLVLKEVGAIIKAIKGNNGVWQIDEVSKIFIYILLYRMVEADRVRTHEWMIFPLSLYILLIFAVLTMAKLESVIDKFIEFVKTWKGGSKNEQTKVDNTIKGSNS